MSKKNKKLKARIESLEARVVALEARPQWSYTPNGNMPYVSVPCVSWSPPIDLTTTITYTK